MIDMGCLKEALEQYKKDFDVFQWKHEEYKWEAVKWFQDNWNITAENFPPNAETISRKDEKLTEFCQ